VNKYLAVENYNGRYNFQPILFSSLFIILTGNNLI